jgi:RimJ/RimL family protein N-acetyltransferase
MSNFELPVLRGERVILRRARWDDVAARLRLGTDAEIHRMYGGSVANLRPLTEEGAKRWLEQLLDQDYAWIIEADTLIGHIKLDRVDFRDRRASLAVGIEDRARLDLGLGTEAIALVLEYAFSVLKLHRLSVRVIEYNMRAIRAYTKSGFVIEGTEREAAFVDGNWYNDIMMGMLDHEYKKMRAGHGVQKGALRPQ